MFLSIGENIKRFREAKGISQYKLAQLLNVSQQSVDQWERSLTNPRKNNIDKISSVLNVSVNELFGIINEENNKMETETKYSTDEQRLIEVYRKLDDRGKKNVLRNAEGDLNILEGK